ncbi:hypothetical protein QBC44DRAFT_209872, partial [Cladorrhinum sp. PSN332]
MPGLDPEAQFKFLLSCIRHSSAGRVIAFPFSSPKANHPQVDFNAVAEELDIVSKAAAAKRYERLLKAHGINQDKTPKNGEGADKAKIPKTPKRKRAAIKNEGDDSDDGESPSRKVKKEK